MNEKEIANKNPACWLFWRDWKIWSFWAHLQHRKLAELSSSCLLVDGDWTLQLLLFLKVSVYLNYLPDPVGIHICNPDLMWGPDPKFFKGVCSAPFLWQFLPSHSYYHQGKPLGSTLHLSKKDSSPPTAHPLPTGACVFINKNKKF